MKLFYTPIAGYVHTVEAVINYAGLRDAITRIPTKPYDPATPLAAINPLCKVPTLVLDGGEYLAGGPVIYEYLDTLHDKTPLHPAGSERWSALRRAWLADGLFDTLVLLIVESWIPAEAQRSDYINRCWQKILRCLERQQADIAEIKAFDIGVVRCVGALSFLDKKFEIFSSALPSLPEPGFRWRARYPALAEWYAEQSALDLFNRPLQGEDR